MDEQNQNLEGQNSNVEPEASNVLNVSEANVEGVQESTNGNVGSTEQVVNYEKIPTSNETNVLNGKNKKNNVGIIVGIFAAVIVLIVLCGAFIVLRGNKGERFLKMFENDYLLRIPKEICNIALNNNNINASAEIDIDKFVEDLGAESNNAGKISLNTSTLRNKMNFATTLTLNSNKEELAKAKLVLNDKKIGLAVPGLFERYVAVDLNDIDGLVKNFNLDEEDVEKFVEALKNNIESAEKTKKISERYLKILTKQISNKINVEKNAIVKINGNENKTNKYFLKLESKDMMNIKRVILSVAKKDKELYDLLSKQEEFDYTWEEWQEEIDDSIREIEYEFKNNYIGDASLTLEAFVKGNNTLAARIIYVEGEYEILNIAVSSYNNKADSYLEVKFGSYGFYESLIFNSKMEKNKLNTDMYMKVDTDDGKQKFKLLTFTVEGKKVSNPKIDVISDSALMLNSATQKSMEKFASEVEENIPTYLSDIYSKLPEGMKEVIDSLSDLNHGIEYYEDDYDYNYDDDYDYDYDYDYDEDYDEDYGV